MDEDTKMIKLRNIAYLTDDDGLKELAAFIAEEEGLEWHLVGVLPSETLMNQPLGGPLSALLVFHQDEIPVGVVAI